MAYLPASWHHSVNREARQGMAQTRAVGVGSTALPILLSGRPARCGIASSTCAARLGRRSLGWLRCCRVIPLAQLGTCYTVTLGAQVLGHGFVLKLVYVGVTGVTGVTISNGAACSCHPCFLCWGDRGDKLPACHPCHPLEFVRGDSASPCGTRLSPVSPLSLHRKAKCV